MARTPRTPKKREWAEAFFSALEDTHLVTEAVKRAGVARSTAYKRRDEDPAFAERWADVEERSTEVLEQIAVKRAAQGSDVLLMFLLKSRRPSVYRENRRVEPARVVEEAKPADPFEQLDNVTPIRKGSA